MEKIIVLRDKTFKCLPTGECFVLRENNGRMKLKNPYWFQLSGIENGYYRYTFNNKSHMSIHRIIAYAFLNLDIEDAKQVIDHLDGNGLNNNIENLRVVTSLENARNRHDKVKGIYKYEKFYYAQIGIGNSKRESKSFQTQEEAVEWRLEKEKEFGYKHSTCLK